MDEFLEEWFRQLFREELVGKQYNLGGKRVVVS